MPELYNELSFVVDLDKPIITTKMYNLFVTTSKKAHKVILTLRRGGQAINFTGNVTATLITRADMVTQDANGEAEDGKVTFVFPPSFYGQSGIFDLIIFVDDQDSHVPVFGGEGSMILGQTDTLYDPDHVVPSLAELLAQIENTREAAASANSAASSANNAAASANSAATEATTATNNANAATTAANNAAQTANTAASNANAATTNANNAAGAANQAAGRAEIVASKSPYIGDNGNWYVYDVEQGAFVDSGSSAKGLGDVSSVNGVTPDHNGDVTLNAENIGAYPAERLSGLHTLSHFMTDVGTIKFQFDREPNSFLLLMGRSRTPDVGMAVYALSSYSSVRQPSIAELSKGDSVAVSTSGDNDTGWYVNVTNTFSGGGVVLYFVSNCKIDIIQGA